MSMRQPPTLPTSAVVPARLGKYTITGVLGEGAMGTVYRGVDPVIQRTVAVKTIRRHLLDASASELSVALRFRNEAQAAGRLSHPGIVGVYEYGEEHGDAFIAMEYVEGMSLAHFMARPELLPESDMLSLMVQLLDALHYAHERGVWHRDIKPNNIIVTPGGKLKVADFGIARIESAGLTQMSLLLGSPGYIAPERYTGEAPDRRVDIFSCGVLLYHLLTGRSPFPGTETEVMYKVLHKDPTPPSQTAASPTPPRYFDAIVVKALAKRPDDRYETALEFREALLKAGVLPIPPTVSMAVVESVKPRVDATTSAEIHRAMPAVGPGAEVEAVSLPSHPAGWDAALIQQLTTLLAEHLGPIAGVLVRRTAKQCVDIGDLIGRLGADTLSPEDRKLFLARTAKLVPPAPPGSRAGAKPRAASDASTVMLPVLNATPLLPETIVKAERVLTSHIGPIARVMVKKAAASASGREEFYLVLAGLAGDDVDRERLLGDLQRIV